MTRLEAHRDIFWAQDGRGAMLRLEDLDSDEYELLNIDFFSKVKESDAKSLDEIYGAYQRVLYGWGVMCPHPLGYRLYGGEHPASAPMPFETYKWYACKLCKAAVINR